MLSALAQAAPNCPDECGELNEQAAQFEKSIKRLSEIKAVNVAYIATLDGDQDSQRLKAKSNVSIADKRITAEQEKSKIVDASKKKMKCYLCGEK